MFNKRVLIISNNALSDTNSNGRTLKNFLSAEDRDNVSQFFIQNDAPDFSSCKSFFCATDGQVLRAFLKRKSAGRVLEEGEKNNEASASTSAKRKTKKNPFTMLVRNFVWNRKGWRKDFYGWVDGVAPQVVLLQAGDSPFLYDLSVEISEKYGIPLMIYNSEDYYFKKYNYFRKSGLWGVFYPLFRAVLKKSTKRAIERSSLSIYISEDLKSIYDEEFGSPGEYIYTSTEVVPCVKEKDEFVFSYLGNLGLNRHLGLIKIAEALGTISPDFKLDVYGKTPCDEVKYQLEKCPWVNYKGLIGYEEVKRVIQKSMLVFHTESFEEFYARDIAHGFSTKIADSLASGTCFVIYAPENISCAKYLYENDCAVVITDEFQLRTKLSEVIYNSELREGFIERAAYIARKNHDSQKNRDKFASLINGL